MTKGLTQHWVVWGKKKRVTAFEDSDKAYRFWTRLRRGIYAEIYVDGALVARGTGLEFPIPR